MPDVNSGQPEINYIILYYILLKLPSFSFLAQVFITMA